MPQLLLLRHAKSSRDDPSLPDRDRPLAPRGRRASELLARWLADESVAPDLVLCSPARRAIETLEGIAPALPTDAWVRVEPVLYEGDAAEIVAHLRTVGDEVRCALVVGHNPTIARLAVELAASDGGVAEACGRYPTGALARLSFPGSWGDLAPGAARLVELVTPRRLDGA